MPWHTTKVTRQILPTIGKGAAVLMACSLAMPAHAGTDNASGRARVLTQISIANTGDLDFGTLLRGTAAGTATIKPNSDARTTTGGTVAAGGTPRAASFAISGTPNRLVSIRVAPNPTILSNGSGGTIRVNTFRLNGAANRRLSAAGTIALRVGARINLAANQADGVYTGTFNVTINYL